MIPAGLLLGVAIGYPLLLFAIAWYGDRRADQGRSVIANPWVYTLSIAVYCTAWTFYGSVGRAAGTGLEFLTVYLGPTLMAVLWWQVLRKMVRISKLHRITSIADFIASRYGKSGFLAGLATVIAVVGIMPYIALQLKAVAVSFEVLGTDHLQAQAPAESGQTAFYVAMLLALFAILYGTRHIDATERHEGMVLAVAFESLTKLLAFLAVGVFVTFGLFDGFGDLFVRAGEAGLAELSGFAVVPGGYPHWLTVLFLSMMAILFLPRQFQLLVVENVNERHIRTAAWLFPLYLLIINLFVLPIALAGLLQFPEGDIEADTFVLSLPMSRQAAGLAVFAFIGGLSAATGMVIVASITLSTMICNDLVMPVLLRIRVLGLRARTDLSRLLIYIRRGAILAVVLLGYLYFSLIGESYALVSIGLVSFAAAAQFAPAVLLGMYWKGGTRTGAVVGLSAGFGVWLYTLLLPSFALSGWLPVSFVEQGPFGMALLKPYQLFGLEGLEPLAHAVFWSMLANLGGLVLVSLFSERSALERLQAELFVDVFKHSGSGAPAMVWRGTASSTELRGLLARFLGTRQADRFMARYQGGGSIRRPGADARLVQHAERLLAGAIGSASARVMVASVVKGEVLGIDEVMKILDETSQILSYSQRLEEKSRQLEQASSELRAANRRLQELDRLKDDFVSTVTHELRTPLTSIRAFSEILLAEPDMDSAQRQEFLGIVVKETERLTRLINDVLDFARIESGRVDWDMRPLDLRELVEVSLRSTSQLFRERSVKLSSQLDPTGTVVGDHDRLVQVVVNLLSNAVKFCDPERGLVRVRLNETGGYARLEVIDNGAGIAADLQGPIFQKFRQLDQHGTGKPTGTGLGLAISQGIVTRHGGRIEVHSVPGQGATFRVDLPLSGTSPDSMPATAD